jgi:hypothetical protein
LGSSSRPTTLEIADQLELLGIHTDHRLAPTMLSCCARSPGVQRRTAEVIVAEIGVDISVFPTAKELAF